MKLSPVSVPITKAPFLALEYDPVKKGNAIIISTGVETVDYEPAVDAPVELTANMDTDGRLDSLEFLLIGAGQWVPPNVQAAFNRASHRSYSACILAHISALVPSTVSRTMAN